MNPIHRQNLVKLALGFMFNPPPKEKFDIGSYIGNNELPSDNPIYSDCDTTACIAGHGPVYGIPKLEYERWDQYVKRVFGTVETPDLNYYKPWNYLFGPSSANEHAGIEGGANRLAYYVLHESTCDNPNPPITSAQWEQIKALV